MQLRVFIVIAALNFPFISYGEDSADPQDLGAEELLVDPDDSPESIETELEAQSMDQVKPITAPTPEPELVDENGLVTMPSATPEPATEIITEETEKLPSPLAGLREEILKGGTKICNCRVDYGTPYFSRRPRWGFSFGLSVSTYQPTDYLPFSTLVDDYAKFYGTAQGPATEGFFLPKINTSLGSLGLEFRASLFSAKRPNVGSASSLSVLNLLTGVYLALDTIFDEPYLVPFGSAGVYVVGNYKEISGGTEVGGSLTLTSPRVGGYAMGGVMFGLNWLDSTSARTGYVENGLEQTYVYIAARTISNNTSTKVTSERGAFFGSPLHMVAGLILEF